MQELTVRSESIQRLYNFYTEEKLVVNRRYQRKLVWSIEEKEAFIDSIAKEYPVPMILLAENDGDRNNILEIIDGMQRLNAIVAFIENEITWKGQYFDLETMAETKLQKDEKTLIQNEPILDRKICAKIVSYVFPISTYKGATEDEIDEVFRRINANGKHLSKQEIRQAGAVSGFAEIVRKISSEIRGDVSLNDRVVLNKMKLISITSKELKYGINVDDVFWVSSSIIRREQVRESKDEEIIAEIVATMVLPEIPATSSTILDEYYGLKGNSKRKTELDEKLVVYGQETIRRNFFKVFDQLKALLDISGKSFNSLISKDRTFDKVPRYFQVVFLAFYRLIVVEGKKITSQYEIIKLLDGITANIKLGQGGGNWSAKERENGINAVVGIISKYFVENKDDPAVVKWSTEFETILMQSKVEQNCFDYKIGFCDLKTGVFNEAAFRKCIKTLTSMANKGKDSVGYIIAGVAEKEEDAKKLIETDSTINSIEKNGFYIVGLNYDIKQMNLTQDRYFQKLIQIINKEPIDEKYKAYIGSNIKFINYAEKPVLIIKIKGLDIPAIYDNNFYQRMGANVDKIEPRDMGNLFDRFKG